MDAVESPERNAQKSAWEPFLYLVLIAAAGGSLLAFLRPAWFGLRGPKEFNRSIVAEVQRQTGQVRRKDRGSMVWQDILQAVTPVSIGDTVYTGPAGIAQVRFEGGLSAKLEPNSLVTFSEPRQRSTGWLHWGGKIARSPVISLSSGGAQFIVERRTAPIVIEAGGRKFRLESGSGSPPGSPFAVRIVTAAGRNPELEISTRSQTNLRVVPEGAAGAQPIDVRNSEPVRIPIVSAAEQVDENVAAPKVTGGGWTAPPFSVLPVRLGTRVVKQIELHRLPLLLQWPPVDGAAYSLLVFNGNKVLLSQKNLKQPSFGLIMIAPSLLGYSYQITATLPSGRSFQSNRAPIYLDFESPLIKTPARRVRPKQVLMFTWQRTALTSSYEFQISNDAAFRRILVDRRTRQNLVFYREKIHGRIYARVKSLWHRIESSWSPVIQLSVR